jgi:hypothetical protein
MVESFTINRIPHEIRASQRKALHFRNASARIFAYASDRASGAALLSGITLRSMTLHLRYTPLQGPGSVQANKSD